MSTERGLITKGPQVAPSSRSVLRNSLTIVGLTWQNRDSGYTGQAVYYWYIRPVSQIQGSHLTGYHEDSGAIRDC